VLQVELFGGALPAPSPSVRREAYIGGPLDEVQEAKPGWKWVGGKGQNWPHISPLLPDVIRGAYFEPFFGGGATFWALVREGRLRGPVVLNDKNPLIGMALTGLRDDVRAVLALLRGHETSYRASPLRTYFEVRATVPEWGERSPEAVAAGLIFLNRAGFNGLWRVNRKGAHNVAWCKDAEVAIVFEDRLLACAHALRGAQILSQDFTEVLAHAEPGDVAFLDSPYMPVSATANFTSYTSDGFDGDDQRRLRDEVVRCAARGVHVLACNADVPAVRELYDAPTLEVLSIQSRRAVNRCASSRGPVGEVLIKRKG